MEVALQWLKNARGIMSEIENTQQENITKAATLMADCIILSVADTRRFLFRKCTRVSAVS